MPVQLHWHRFPSCGTTCNTACSSMGEERSCTQAEHIPGREGEWGCTHVTGEKPAQSTGSDSYVNADGDVVTVSTWSDGSTLTVCQNGTVTLQTSDGARESINDPLHGSPIMVSIAPDGSRSTELPNGTKELVQPDGTVVVTAPDGRSTTVQPDGQVVIDDGQRATTGVTLDEAVRRGHLTDLQVVSTGENTGSVAVLVSTCDGKVPFVYVPPSILTPADPVTNQTLDTQPTVVDTSTPGPIEAEIPGACRNDPALPPAPSGDTGIRLDPTPVGDPSPFIGDIVDGALQHGTVPDDLVVTREDTARTLDQVTRWLRNESTPEQLVSFLMPRIPGTPEQQREKAQEITEWGARLVDKTRNLDKQVAEAPEVPPV